MPLFQCSGAGRCPAQVARSLVRAERSSGLPMAVFHMPSSSPSLVAHGAVTHPSQFSLTVEGLLPTRMGQLSLTVEGLLLALPSCTAVQLQRRGSSRRSCITPPDMELAELAASRTSLWDAAVPLPAGFACCLERNSYERGASPNWPRAEHPLWGYTVPLPVGSVQTQAIAAVGRDRAHQFGRVRRATL